MTNQERLQANNEAIENIQQTLASKMVMPAADYATIEDVENAVKDKATIAYVDTKVADLVNSAPETLDTLGEVATAIQNNSNVVDALNSAIGNKVDKVSGKGLSTNDYTTEEKNKLAGLSNYDDTAIKSQINNKASIADMTTYINEHKDELKGDAGANGKSAYEYAKDGGYTGTEQEFIEKMAEDVVEAIDEINSILAPLKEGSINIFNREDVTFDRRRINSQGHTINSWLDAPGCWQANQIWSCKKGDVIRCNTSWHVNYLIYDTNGNFITDKYFDDSQQYTVTQDNAGFFTVMCMNCTDLKNQFEKVMVTLNNPLPSTYTPYVDTVSIETIGENKSAIENLQKGVPYFEKPFVVLSYDAFNLTDKRFEITNNEYGFKATIAHKKVADIEINKTVMNAGWDIGLYNYEGSPALVEGQYDAAVSENPTPEILEAWDKYVKTAIDDGEEAMVYNPTVWLAQQGCSCYGLETALKKYGIPMCRGAYNPTYANDWEYSSKELPVLTVAVKQTIMPSTIEACKTNIAEAVANGTGVAFLTHGIYSTDTEANNNYGVTEACLRDFLDTVKSYVDAGKLEVITYRELYARYYPEKGKERDYNRTIKMILSQKMNQ